MNSCTYGILWYSLIKHDVTEIWTEPSRVLYGAAGDILDSEEKNGKDMGYLLRSTVKTGGASARYAEG
jgi:hypothetical protein